MNHKVFFALLACLSFCFPTFGAAEPVGAVHPARVHMRPAMVPQGDVGPAQVSALPDVSDATPARPSPAIHVTQPPVERVLTSRRVRPHPASQPRRDAWVWASWMALVAGASAVGMGLAWGYIVVFYGGPVLLLLFFALLLAVSAIILGGHCIGSLQNQPYAWRGLMALILGIFSFVWPLIAAFHYLVIEALS
jgi:hypothetical protein